MRVHVHVHARTCAQSETGSSVATLAISTGVRGATIVARETRQARARMATAAMNKY